MALDPDLKIIAPWKDPTLRAARPRERRSNTPQKHNVPIPVSKKKIYSQDRNLWHISHEGAEIEHPDEGAELGEVPDDDRAAARRRRTRAEIVEVEFRGAAIRSR